MKILVTRPLPGGEATAARLRALGHEVVLAPLMETEAVAWQPPTVTWGKTWRQVASEKTYFTVWQSVSSASRR